MQHLANLRTEIDDDGVALIHLDVAGRAMNVWTDAFGLDLQKALEDLAPRPEVKGIVVTSAKPGSFMLSGDPKRYLEVCERDLSARRASA